MINSAKVDIFNIEPDSLYIRKRKTEIMFDYEVNAEPRPTAKYNFKIHFVFAILDSRLPYLTEGFILLNENDEIIKMGHNITKNLSMKI